MAPPTPAGGDGRTVLRQMRPPVATSILNRETGAAETTDITPKKGIVPAFPCDEFFTPAARVLCARIKHKSELTDDEMLMLAMAAPQAPLAKLFPPGAPDRQKRP